MGPHHDSRLTLNVQEIAPDERSEGKYQNHYPETGIEDEQCAAVGIILAAVTNEQGSVLSHRV